VPEVFDTIDVCMSIGEFFAVIDALMMKFRYVQRVVSSPAIGVDNRVWQHLAADNWHERRTGGIGDHAGIDLAAALEQSEDRNLACRSSASLAFARAAEVTFVHLHLAIKGPFFFQAAGDNLAELVIEQVSRVVVHPRQISGSACRDLSNEQLQQLQLLGFAQSASLYLHHA